MHVVESLDRVVVRRGELHLRGDQVHDVDPRHALLVALGGGLQVHLGGFHGQAGRLQALAGVDQIQIRFLHFRGHVLPGLLQRGRRAFDRGARFLLSRVGEAGVPQRHRDRGAHGPLGAAQAVRRRHVEPEDGVQARPSLDAREGDASFRDSEPRGGLDHLRALPQGDLPQRR